MIDIMRNNLYRLLKYISEQQKHSFTQNILLSTFFYSTVNIEHASNTVLLKNLINRVKG